MRLSSSETIRPAENFDRTVKTKYGACLVEEFQTGGFSIFTAKITMSVSGEIKEISRAGRTAEVAARALENVLANEILISRGIH